jgi:intracellular sulfur oxidation DsrE/DsrF family protein
MKKIAQVLIFIFAAIFLQSGISAKAYSEDNALHGAKEIKAYFDVKIGDPEKLLIRLQLIEKTRIQLAASGLLPRFVIGVRGPASNFFTKDGGYVLVTDVPVKKEIAARVEQFKTQGFRLEQCRIAAGMQEILVADFLPQLEVIDNGYVSMISYQHQGYAFVPMD